MAKNNTMAWLESFKWHDHYDGALWACGAGCILDQSGKHDAHEMWMNVIILWWDYHCTPEKFKFNDKLASCQEEEEIQWHSLSCSFQICNAMGTVSEEEICSTICLIHIDTTTITLWPRKEPHGKSDLAKEVYSLPNSSSFYKLQAWLQATLAQRYCINHPPKVHHICSKSHSQMPSPNLHQRSFDPPQNPNQWCLNLILI